jgi:hypothetical protein
VRGGAGASSLAFGLTDTTSRVRIKADITHDHALLEGVMAIYSLMRFLDFLQDSGRWSGSQESFQRMHGILGDILCSEVLVMIRHRPIPEHFTTGSAE